MRESFYVVWQPETGAPRFRHTYQYQAEQEAERLAAQNPGKEFFVLRACTALKHASVHIELLEDALPF